MYDPLAAYYLLNPKSYSLQKMDIAIETRGAITRGMTVAEKRKWGEKKTNIEVATIIERETFIKDFLSIIGS